MANQLVMNAIYRRSMDLPNIQRTLHDEDSRLKALADLAVLDTPAEAEFDDLTALSASLFGVESAAISLVDHDRQWFKSRVNLPFRETARDIAFCHYTVEQRDLLIVVDATRDPRFCDNPLVTSEGGIRFYAGAPLIVDSGQCVGSLCIIDTVPRSGFDEQERALLQGLARLASTLLVARRARRVGEIAAKVVQNTSDGIVAADHFGKIVLLNPAAERLFGCPAEQALGQDIERIMPQAFRHERQKRIDEAASCAPSSAADAVVELPIKTADGREIPTELSLAPWGTRLSDGGLATILRDVTHRKAIEKDNRQARNLLDTIVSNLPAALFVKDLHTRKYVFVNEKGAEVIGLPREQILGQRDRDLFGAVGKAFEDRDLQAGATDQPFRYESKFVRKDGRSFDIRTTRVVLDGPDGPGQYILGLGEDMTAFRRNEAEKTWLSRYDHLTGLLNRTSLSHRLDDFIGQGAPFAMVGINLDRFKAVNEEFGQSAGDAVLREIAIRLEALVDDQCIIGRAGGDEYVILIKGDELDERAIAIAEKAVRVAATPFATCGVNTRLLASVGVAFFPSDGRTPETLRDNVNLALGRAKKAGGARTCLFDATLDAEIRDRRRLESDLREAIARDDIVLHYQPIVSTRTGEVTSVEALARWNHETRGPVSPEIFIAMAEDTGLIEDLAEQLLDRACHDLLAMPDELRLAVNLSPYQFKSGKLPSNVGSALARAGLAPHRLQFEVTERLVIENAEETFHQLEQLRALGIKILMDDFGVGHSSLSYFTTFPFDKVKIDKSFIAEIETSNAARAIVEAVVGIGRQLSMGIVAEGVENESQQELLSKLGCSHLQGYHLSRALPPEEIAPFVAERASRAKLVLKSAPRMTKVA